MAITSNDVRKSATVATLAAMELEHCKLTAVERSNLAAAMVDAIEAYLNALIETGYRALPKYAIANIMNCSNCEHFEPLDGYPNTGRCTLLKMDVAISDFCSEWIKDYELEKGLG